MNKEQMDLLYLVLRKILYAFEPAGYYEPEMSGLSSIDREYIRKMLDTIFSKEREQ